MPISQSTPQLFRYLFYNLRLLYTAMLARAAFPAFFCTRMSLYNLSRDLRGRCSFQSLGSSCFCSSLSLCLSSRLYTCSKSSIRVARPQRISVFWEHATAVVRLSESRSSLNYVAKWLNFRVLGIRYSGISDCTDANVGYTLDTNFFGIDVGRDSTRVFAKALSGSLIINAIAAGTAVFSLLFAFFAWFCSSRFMEVVSCHEDIPSAS